MIHVFKLSQVNEKENNETFSNLTTLMLRLLSSKAQGIKDFLKNI